MLHTLEHVQTLQCACAQVEERTVSTQLSEVVMWGNDKPLQMQVGPCLFTCSRAGMGLQPLELRLIYRKVVRPPFFGSGNQQQSVESLHGLANKDTSITGHVLCHTLCLPCYRLQWGSACTVRVCLDTPVDTSRHSSRGPSEPQHHKMSCCSTS